MSAFPLTSMTLIQKLSAGSPEGNEAAWVRFFGLYTPAIRRFVEWRFPSVDADDAVQEVYLRLVEILGSGKYRPDKARFHTFLVLLIHRLAISHHRKEVARGEGMTVAFDDLEVEPAVPADQMARIDADWARAKHEAAVEHVLTQVALSAQTRSVYRAYALEERPADDVARAFGVSKSVLYKIKNRVDRMVAAIEGEYDDESSAGGANRVSGTSRSM